MKIFKNLKKKFLDPKGYAELDISKVENKKRVLVKEITIDDLSKIKPVLNFIKEKSVIVLINFKPLKEKSETEFKMAAKRFKEFSNLTNGDIAFVGEDWLVLTPRFVEIDRGGLKHG